VIVEPTIDDFARIKWKGMERGVAEVSETVKGGMASWTLGPKEYKKGNTRRERKRD